jgi:hypothetical protein
MSDEKLDVIQDNEDWFLQRLIDLVNGQDTEIGITLNVGGFLISGLLVSGHRYFEGFGQEFCGALKDENMVKSLKEIFSEFGKIYSKENAEGEEVPPPRYIHLRNAKFINSNDNPVPGNRGVWWRGRVSEVSGFILGILKAEE